MKSKEKKPSFTIVELLVVMSIIIILIGLLLPSLNAVRRFAKDVTQKSQFHDITNGLEVFKIDFDDEYPDSSRYDIYGGDYCGAMKLCEAMVGKDKLGFNIYSEFTEVTAGMPPPNTTRLYFDAPLTGGLNPDQLENLSKRQAPYVNPDVVQIATMEEVYGGGSTGTGAFDPCDCVVICDVYGRQRGGPRKLGMPVLYYKANTTKMYHDTTQPIADCCDVVTYIYNYCDNVDLTALWAYGQTEDHPIYIDPTEFYINTKNPEATIMEKPYNEGFYILLSAGHDGLYGTRDDVYNFVD